MGVIQDYGLCQGGSSAGSTRVRFSYFLISPGGHP
jgi:hypothetical protein